MRILYIVPNINNEGGVARVLSLKANYLVEKLGYEVHILTQNGGYSPLFYSFNANIVFHDMILKGNFIQFFNSFMVGLKSNSEVIKPDIIVVCDNGLKAFAVPFILKNKIPLVLEMHSSKFIEESEIKQNACRKLLSYSVSVFKKAGIERYDRFVVLTKESVLEWEVKNTIAIPNPLWFTTDKGTDLKSKRVIAAGRHTYEKGFDRMLQIWKKVLVRHPDWILDIYGKPKGNINLRLLAKELNISENVVLYEPVQNIDEKYLEASFYLMTSRFEGFGMVLIEAMASGLPCIAYDCPCGPRAIISQNEDGFLIEDGNESDCVDAVVTLIENVELREAMAKKAKLTSKKYHIDEIMVSWDQLFNEIKKESKT